MEIEILETLTGGHCNIGSVVMVDHLLSVVIVDCECNQVVVGDARLGTAVNIMDKVRIVAEDRVQYLAVSGSSIHYLCQVVRAH